MRAPVIAVLLLLLVSPGAHAQQPPPCYPCAVAPPSPAELAALEQAARHKRAAGIALMAAGGGLIVAGTALSIAGAWDNDDRCRHTYYGTYHYGASWCGDQALTIAGATTALIGAGSLGIGVPTYLSGNAQLRRALWLRGLGM
jgi:hypothetical protein